MADFLQLHFLTAYPPSNLNRDDTGRPKSAIFGGVPRLRISSQSQKRAFRTSEIFAKWLGEERAMRTRKAGDFVFNLLTNKLSKEDALLIAKTLVPIFGTPATDGKRPIYHAKEVAFLSALEMRRLEDIARRVLEDEKFRKELLSYGGETESESEEPAEDEAERVKKKKKKGGMPKKRLDELRESVLTNTHADADIAMFGRMLAQSPKFKCEAAVQVAHALTTHKALAEDDYYTAVDDLKNTDDVDEAGAGFVSQQEFGAGVFYIYICVDRGLLRKNLGGDASTWTAAISALVEAAAKVSPTGKQNSYASRAHAIYALGEKGPQQPRSLAAAFLDPVFKGSQHTESVKKLEDFQDRLDAAYGACWDSKYVMNVTSGEGTLAGLINFAIL